MQYYTAIKRKELLNTNMKHHRCHMLSVKSQTQKATYFMIPSLLHYEKEKSIETENINGSQVLDV